jgi:hypothetical protein
MRRQRCTAKNPCRMIHWAGRCENCGEEVRSHGPNRPRFCGVACRVAAFKFRKRQAEKTTKHRSTPHA